MLEVKHWLLSPRGYCFNVLEHWDFGEEMNQFTCFDLSLDGGAWLHKTNGLRMIVGGEIHADKAWIHASISRPDRMPDYDDIKLMQAAVFGKAGESYMVFPPEDRHVNIHKFCLHLYGPMDPADRLPDFTRGQGSI